MASVRQAKRVAGAKPPTRIGTPNHQLSHAVGGKEAGREPPSNCNMGPQRRLSAHTARCPADIDWEAGNKGTRASSVLARDALAAMVLRETSSGRRCGRGEALPQQP
jgi:hypothetical protein